MLFQFGIEKKKKLQLARDRIGEKPLYYGFSGSGEQKTFLFASELSALKAWKYFDNHLNSLSISQLLKYQAISAPNSIFEGIFQLLPGHFITVNSPEDSQLNNVENWYDHISIIKDGLENQINDEDEAERILENSLKDTLKIQSISDVPLGTFLSGGIDSSLITALLQSESKSKIKTFTIGFEDECLNEANYSKEIAKHLDTDHEELYFTSNEALELIPKLSQIYSEPFADSSQLPTHLVSKLAKNNGLTVALTGDGGDELFGGYNRYFLGEKIWKKIDYVPWTIRRYIGNLGTNININKLNFLNQYFGLEKYASKIEKTLERLKYVRSGREFYLSLLSQWENPTLLFSDALRDKNLNIIPETLNYKLPKELKNDLAQSMMAYDLMNYLPNDILTKVDRALWQ